MSFIEGLAQFKANMNKVAESLENKQVIFKAAVEARNMIYLRTVQKHIGLEGPFEKYSTTPYYRPKKMRPVGKGGRRKHIKTGRPLKSVFYQGGYRQFAALTKGSSRVNLSATNMMFNSMQAIMMGPLESAVAFTRRSEAQKAWIVNQRRPFFGLTPEEAQRIERQIAQGIGKAIKN